jgi:solute carrier family 25 phosphate transporter 3
MAREGGLRELYAGFLPIICKFVQHIQSFVSHFISPSEFHGAHHYHRQIPYAIGQFTVNELCHEIAFRSMSEEKKKNLTAVQKGGISLASGLTAGVAAAVLSQPADTLLSQVRNHTGIEDLIIMITPSVLDFQINKGHGPQGSMVYRLTTLARQAGFKGLFAGLGPRCLMTAGLVAGQFIIYDQIKHGTYRTLSVFSARGSIY